MGQMWLLLPHSGHSQNGGIRFAQESGSNMPNTMHLLSLPSRLPDRVWLLELSHNNLSCLPGGSFQGLWGLGAADFSQRPVGSGWWSTGEPGFLGAARSQPQPAGLPSPGLLSYPGFSALPGPLTTACHPGPL